MTLFAYELVGERFNGTPPSFLIPIPLVVHSTPFLHIVVDGHLERLIVGSLRRLDEVARWEKLLAERNRCLLQEDQGHWDIITCLGQGVGKVLLAETLANVAIRVAPFDKIVQIGLVHLVKRHWRTIINFVHKLIHLLIVGDRLLHPSRCLYCHICDAMERFPVAAFFITEDWMCGAVSIVMTKAEGREDVTIAKLKPISIWILEEELCHFPFRGCMV